MVHQLMISSNVIYIDDRYCNFSCLNSVFSIDICFTFLGLPHYCRGSEYDAHEFLLYLFGKIQLNARFVSCCLLYSKIVTVLLQ